MPHFIIVLIPNINLLIKVKKKKKILFVNTEHTTDQKMGVSVLLRLFISGKPFSDKTKCLFLRNMDPSR